MKIKYTEQDVREFYSKMDKSEGGVFSIHIPTWNEMTLQHPNLVVELEVERKVGGMK